MGWKCVWLCSLALSVAIVSDVQARLVHNHVSSICSTWGREHFKTFDGDVYHFPGMCEYNLVTDCHESYQEFSVHMKRKVSDGYPTVSYVVVTINGLSFHLSKTLITVNDLPVKTPYFNAGVQVEKNAVYIKLQSKVGITVMWNSEDAVMVELDHDYANRTCGLCGDFNGVPVYNEFIHEGRKISPIELGSKHRVHHPNDDCEDPYEEEESLEAGNVPDSCKEFQTTCEQMLHSNSWSSCTKLTKPEPYIQACVQDMCGCTNSTNDFCVCSTLSEFSRQCSHAGGQPPNWRTPQFCAKQCPYNMVYEESGSPCMDTCTHQDTSSLCEDHKMDGCFCPTGTVFDDISMRGCITQSECQCKHGKIYNSNEVYRQSQVECTCLEGRWACKSLQTPATCAIEEGSHVTTFDGKTYTFHGDCYYTLAKVESKFTILGQLVPCASQDFDTCLKTLKILLNNDKNNVLLFTSDGMVKQNTQTVSLPYHSGDINIFHASSFHILLQTSFGLQIQIQHVPIMQVYISLDQSYRAKTRGLCGNYNKVLFDDMKTPQGIVEGTAVTFSNSWKANIVCRDREERLDDPCSLSVENEWYAKHWCALLLSPNGTFAQCRSVVDPEMYYKRCIYASCNCEKSEACLCAVFSSYARACASKGVFLTDWRENVCDKYARSCPESQAFSYKNQRCQLTCRSLGLKQQSCTSDFLPVDGCSCPEGLYLNEKGACVPMEKCPCYYNEMYIKPGKSISIKNEHCVCTNGMLHCHSWRTRSSTCPSPKVFFNCSTAGTGELGVQCARTCLNLDNDDCDSTECESGCQCPGGFIDDGKGSCVKENECPCQHNGHLYAQGTQIPNQCNNCTCKSGRWKCTEKKCPGTCIIYGSGHYHTFDQRTYAFQGQCAYVAVKNKCGNKTVQDNFGVITENVPCGSTGTTCSKTVRIQLGRMEVKLSKGKYEEQDLGNGTEIQYKIRKVGLYLVIESAIGLAVMWDRKTTVRILLEPQHSGEVCGLCGDFDGDGQNDFTTQGQLVVSNPIEFANSWKVSSSCPDVETNVDPCVATPNRQHWAKMMCGIITGDTFKDCHNKVDPLPFHENCVKDSCACDTGGDCECFCTAVAAYAQACNEAGVCVAWRTPEICPVFCDYYNSPDECKWHYRPCHTPCYKTCWNPEGICHNPIPNLEGCYPVCPEDKPIFDEESQMCVEECEGCFYNGTRYEENDVVYNVTDNLGMCYYAICINSTVIFGKEICFPPPITTTPITTTTTKSTTPPTEPPTTTTEEPTTTTKSTTPPTEPPTTTTEEPTTTTKSTTPPTTVTSATTPCITTCEWSEWYDVHDPKVDKSDWETYETITNSGKQICEKPVEIDCRSVDYPDTNFNDFVSQTGQVVTCDVGYGLICRREDQLRPPRKCFNYKIRICCETRICPPPSTTTPEPTTTTKFTTTPSEPTTTTEEPTTTTKSTTTPTEPTTTTPEPTTTTKSTTTPTEPTTTTPEPTTTTKSTTTPTEPTTTTPEPTTTTKSTTPTEPTTTTPEPTTTTKSTTTPTEPTTTTPEPTTTTKSTTTPTEPTTTTPEPTTTTKSTTTPTEPTTTTPEPTTTTKSTTTPTEPTTTTPEPTTTTKSTTTPTEPTTTTPEPTTTTKSTTTPTEPTTTTPEPTTTTKSTTIPTEPTTTTPEPTTTTKSTTSPTEPPTTTTTEEPTTTTKSTTPPTTVTSATTPCITTCEWSEWYDVHDPKVDKSDWETYETITNSGKQICEKPVEIDCRSVDYPDTNFNDFTKSTTTPTEPTTTTPEPTTTTKSTTTPTEPTTTTPEPTTTTKSTTTPTEPTTTTPEPTTTTKSTTTPTEPTTTTPEPTTTTKSTTTPTEPTTTTPEPTTTTKSTTTPTEPTTTTPEPTTTTKSTTTPTEPTTTTEEPEPTTTTPEPTTTTKSTTPPTEPPTTTGVATTTSSVIESPVTGPTLKPSTAPLQSPITTEEPTTTTKSTSPQTEPPTTTQESTTTTKSTTTPTEPTTISPEPTTTTKSTTTPTEPTTTTPEPTTTTKSTTTPTEPTTTTPEPTTTTKSTTTPTEPTTTTPEPTTTTKSTTTPTEPTTTTPEPTTTTKSTTTPTEPTTTTEEPTTTTKSTTPTEPTTTTPKPTTTTKSTTTPTEPTTTTEEPTTTTKSTTPTEPTTTTPKPTTTTKSTTTPTEPTTTTEEPTTTTKSTTPSEPTTTTPKTTTTKSTTTPTEPTTTSPKPTTTTKSTTTPTEPTTTTPEQQNETFYLCNCTMARCIENNTIEIIPYECPPLENITCTNGKKPVLVYDEYHCCQHYACDCVCEGWGDPHYITFDGLYYSYQGNCTYTLMEEIIPLHKLKIYIDNVICDPTEDVSCPRSIVISYQSVVVTLINHNLIGAAQLEALTNGVRLKLPYSQHGVRILNSGINLVFEIPRLKVVITFGITGFSVTLPFQYFGRNTQGHCGTCNNNQADDCMLPGGQLVKSCAVMADYWLAKDIYQPSCEMPSVLPTNKPEPPPTLTPCKPDSMCGLLKSSVFAACHPFVSPDNVYRGCVFDSCHVSNPAVECTSLQTYAAACAQAGVCLHWRNHTKLCASDCPSEKVYQPCGPAEQPTCEDNPNEPTMNFTTEGCFCPDGMKLFNKESGICVNKCGCLDPESIPREFNESFEYNCQNCICEESTKTVTCKPKVCPAPSVANCTGPGFVLVNQTDPSDRCCSAYVCQCQSNTCPVNNMKCPVGYLPVPNVPEGKCCLEHTCEAKRVCVHKEREYELGVSVPGPMCQDCTCTNEMDPHSGLFKINCEFQQCQENCDLGYTYVVGDECCGKCVQTHCTVSVNGTKKLLKQGETWSPADNKCEHYTCVKSGETFSTISSHTVCPPFQQTNCHPDTIQTAANGCCKICVEKEKACKLMTMKIHVLHKDCESYEGVDMPYCEGSCNTFSKYSELAATMQHSCSCCKETRFSNRTIDLHCLNGDVVPYTYMHVEECGCGHTDCTIASGKPARRRRSVILV
ncbi:mucin-2-like [Toxotes jaculatrix]|uniref:mucin-2-like n=1 Tax=Toxotes jaculatrix TaxID=941984 RepID=UPI001B3AB8F0|nr:mucin-2-like [Toxotes jaculatrix]